MPGFSCHGCQGHGFVDLGAVGGKRLEQPEAAAHVEYGKRESIGNGLQTFAAISRAFLSPAESS